MVLPLTSAFLNCGSLVLPIFELYMNGSFLPVCFHALLLAFSIMLSMLGVAVCFPCINFHCVTINLSIPLLMDTWGVSSFRVLGTMNCDCRQYCEHSETCYPGTHVREHITKSKYITTAELLDYKACLLWKFLDHSKLFKISYPKFTHLFVVSESFQWSTFLLTFCLLWL